LSSRSRSGSTPSSRAIVSGFFAATYHAHFAEVEVDPDTGRVTVLRYAVGRTWGARSTRMIEGQVHGGVVQGLGYALFENLRVENGVVVDAGLEAYRLPTALDAPPISIELMETPYPTTRSARRGLRSRRSCLSPRSPDARSPTPSAHP
jgi:CO/xanthine dehydrogenase Mo-binding subunit